MVVQMNTPTKQLNDVQIVAVYFIVSVFLSVPSFYLGEFIANLSGFPNGGLFCAMSAWLVMIPSTIGSLVGKRSERLGRYWCECAEIMCNLIFAGLAVTLLTTIYSPIPNQYTVTFSLGGLYFVGMAAFHCWKLFNFCKEEAQHDTRMPN